MRPLAAAAGVEGDIGRWAMASKCVTWRQLEAMFSSMMDAVKAEKERAVKATLADYAAQLRRMRAAPKD